MKKIVLHATVPIVLFFFLSCNEQNGVNEPSGKDTAVKDSVHKVTPETVNAYAQVDISPMDLSYYPVDYPKLKMENKSISPPQMRILYSRPRLQGRQLFNDLLKYGEPWRLGANEATETQFYQDVSIQGKQIKNGRYSIYCIPEPDKWTVVFNTNVDTWGLKQDTTKDVQRFEIPVTHHNPKLEYLTLVYEKTTTGANLIIGWDEELAKLPINF